MISLIRQHNVQTLYIWNMSLKERKGKNKKTLVQYTRFSCNGSNVDNQDDMTVPSNKDPNLVFKNTWWRIAKGGLEAVLISKLSKEIITRYGMEIGMESS